MKPAIKINKEQTAIKNRRNPIQPSDAGIVKITYKNCPTLVPITNIRTSIQEQILYPTIKNNKQGKRKKLNSRKISTLKAIPLIIHNTIPTITPITKYIRQIFLNSCVAGMTTDYFA
ncbi:MAG: hypothetical protein ABL857_03435, partial [Rickettsiales bacterium]